MNKNLVSIVFVILVIIIGFVIYTSDNDGQTPSDTDPRIQSQEERTPEVQQAVDRFKQTLTTKHQYVDGRHIFLGDFEVPNVCYSYTLNVSDLGDDKVINIDYVDPTIKDCPSPEPAEKGFVSSFKAPENQSVRARVNGEEVNLNIIEVPAGEDIAEYQI